MHYRRYKAWTISDPEVLAIIAGAVRFAKNYYFKIDPVTGQHEAYAVNRLLRERLPVTAPTASRLLAEAVAAGLIPWGKYVPPYKLPKPPREAKPPREPKPKAETPKVVKPVKPAEPKELPEPLPSKRFFLVQRGEFWGFFDNDHASVTLLSRNKQDAINSLNGLLRGEKKPYKKPLDKILDEQLDKAETKRNLSIAGKVS